MILRLTCSVTWTGLLVFFIVGSTLVEGEDECQVSDLSKSNDTGIDCRPQHGMYGYEVLNQGAGTKRRTTGDFARMDELPSVYTDEGKSSDGKDRLSKTLSKKALKGAFTDGRMQGKGPVKNFQNAAGTSAYKYKERIKKEPKGCGFPICVDVDMRLKRFSSMCTFSKWMKETNQENKVFMVQKGECAHLIEGRTEGKNAKKRPWAKNNGRGRKAADACRQHDGCNTKICINDDGVAKTFPNVRQAMFHMKGGYGGGSYSKKSWRSMTRRNVIAVGLGDCIDLYQKGCINTEWFDLDDPVSDDVEEESVPYAHQLVINSDPKKMKIRFSRKGKEETMDSGEITMDKSGEKVWSKKPHLGIHRSCPPEEIVGDAEFRTTSGEARIKDDKPGCLYSDTTLAFKCKSHKNKDPLPKEYSWNFIKPNVTCRDWKFRYCCKDMWGEAASYGKVVQVDKPHIKKLTEGCTWRQYISIPKNKNGDNEAKEFHLQKKKKLGLHPNNVCQGFAMGTRFIDVRTSDKEGQLIPYDEVPDQNILKISAVYGFICSGKNCKNYKVKYCCINDKRNLHLGTWSQWSSWSKCDRSCGGGIKRRTRDCPKGEGECYAPMDKPKEQERSCNEKIECPTEPGESNKLGNVMWTDWSAWSDCSKSCGPGTQKAQRYCKGKACKEKKESKEKECRSEECPKYAWGQWSPWAGCNWKECDKVSTATRQRKCLNTAKNNKVCEDAECEGGEKAATETGGKCPYKPCKQDGKWSEWDEWGFCNEFCEKMRRRHCDSPPQKGTGKPCEGPSMETKKCKNPPEGKKCPSKEPCRYSDWGMWSSCSHFCGDLALAGDGLRERHRHVMSKNVKACQGKDHKLTKQYEECIHCDDLNNEKYASKTAEDFEHMKDTCLKQCPSDCEYGLWSAWDSGGGNCVFCRDSKSPKSYGEATERMRTRAIVKMAENGGRPCDESKLKQQEKCPEPVKCDQWKQWSEWTVCRTVTGQSVLGVQERKRTCKTKKCPKKVETETKDGCLHMCKETEPYGEWSKWSPCKTESKEKNGQHCGKGKRKRSRKCHAFVSKTGGPKAVKKFCRFGETHSVEDECDLGPCERFSYSGYGFM